MPTKSRTGVVLDVSERPANTGSCVAGDAAVIEILSITHKPKHPVWLFGCYTTDLSQPAKGPMASICSWIRLVSVNLLDQKIHLTIIECRISPRNNMRQQGIGFPTSLEEVIHPSTPRSAYYLARLGSDLHIYH
jgi:hypothetical protein